MKPDAPCGRLPRSTDARPPRSGLRPTLAALGAATVLVGAWAANGQAPGAAPAAARHAAYAPRFERRPTAGELGELGRALFFDASLSASGQLACASCHDPAHAYGPPNALSVQLGGPNGRQSGTRAAPSLRYLQTVPPFSLHHHDNDGDDSIDTGPTGGRTWDGRADSGHAQARLPLLSANEMANATPAAVVDKLRRAAYAERMKAVFGPHLFDDADAAFDAALLALETFEDTPALFYPYTSKYDEVLRGRARLTAQEQRGLALFDDPAKGNCAACHISAPTQDGAFPLFTDYGHIALGVPRNRGLPVNADPAYRDMGLCGPLRTDLRDRPDLCGLFRTPSLRNVAVRQRFFHNGVFRTLDEVLAFYARRDTEPQRFYPRDAAGRVQRYDDLPPALAANVNQEPPFGRHLGQRPAFSESESRDIVAFLKTLTDADLLAPKR